METPPSDKPMKPPAPWVPMTNALDLAVLGKLIEELNEAGKIAARCIIQGIDEADPTTGKINRVALAEELADVYASADHAIQRFFLSSADTLNMTTRAGKKFVHLKGWHDLLRKMGWK